MNDNMELALMVIPFGAIMIIFAGIIVSIVYYPGSDIMVLTYLLYISMAIFVIGYMNSRFIMNKKIRAERQAKYDREEKASLKKKTKHEEE